MIEWGDKMKEKKSIAELAMDEKDYIIRIPKMERMS